MSSAQLPGRPRDESIDQRILDAAITLLAGEGFEATTIDAVAKAASVSRPAVYRRFANRGELIIHASRYVFNELAPAVRKATDPLDEVRALLENTIALLTSTPAGAVFRHLIPYLDKDEGFSENANAIGMARRRHLKKAVLQAVEADLLTAPANIDLWLDKVLGAIYFRFLITGRSLDKAYVEDLLHE